MDFNREERVKCVAQLNLALFLRGCFSIANLFRES